MAERQLPKLHTRVRFPSPAPKLNRILTLSRYRQLQGAKQRGDPEKGQAHEIWNTKRSGPGRCFFPSSAMRAMANVPAGLFRVRVVVPPVVTPITAIGIGIAGSEVFTICLRVELR